MRERGERGNPYQTFGSYIANLWDACHPGGAFLLYPCVHISVVLHFKERYTLAVWVVVYAAKNATQTRSHRMIASNTIARGMGISSSCMYYEDKARNVASGADCIAAACNHYLFHYQNALLRSYQNLCSILAGLLMSGNLL